MSEKLGVCNTGCVKCKFAYSHFDWEATDMKLQVYDYLNKIYLIPPDNISAQEGEISQGFYPRCNAIDNQ